jgi:hypothetical protein
MLGLVGIAVAACSATGRQEEPPSKATGFDPAKEDHSALALSEGQRIFRFETFGDEEFWTDKARLHEVVAQSVSPALALKVGLKVDADAILPTSPQRSRAARSISRARRRR